MERGDRRAILPAFSIAALGGATILWVTQKGVGISPDSGCYIALARNLAAGRGFVLGDAGGGWVPFTHFPPLYPAVLACFELLGTGAVAGARLLGAGFFCANIALFWLLARRHVQGSFWLPLLGALFVALSTQIAEVHSMAWSEPLYFFLTLAGFIALDSYREKPGPRALLLSALTMGLAFLTRYAGLAAAAAGLAAVARRRVQDAGAYLALSCGPMGLWLLRNRLLAHQATDGRWALHHPVLPGLSEVAPDALAVLALAALAATVPKERRSDWSRRLEPQFAFCAFYAALFVFLAVFAFPDLFKEYPRYATPVRLSLALMALPLLRGRRGGAAVRLVPGGLALLLAGRMFSWGREVAQDGQQYAGERWKDSEIVACVRALPKGVHIYTNSPTPIYLYAGKDIIDIPLPEDSYGAANPAYPEDVASMRGDMGRGAVLAYFKEDGNARLEEWVRRECGAFTVRQTEDGIFCSKRG